MILCHLMVWPVVPWLLVNSAENFLTFLGSYVCFVSLPSSKYIAQQSILTTHSRSRPS